MIRREDFIRALGEGDARFDAAVDAALLQSKEKEEYHVKKKLSIGLIAAIIAVLALAGAALAVGLNLFEVFGRYDERLTKIALQAEPATETPGEMETKEIGTSAVEIVNTYYDGESLIVAYTEENTDTFAPFTPTAEELAKMEIWEEGCELFEFGALDPVQQAFNDALRAGKPYGFVHYSVFASEQMYAGENGEIELIPSMGNIMNLEDGRKATLLEFDTTLPKGARNQEKLELHLPILQTEYREWFDGENVYILNGPITAETRTYQWVDGRTYTSYGSDPVQIGMATATVKRSEAETRRYAGEGSYNSAPVQAEAQVTAMRATVRLTSGEEMIHDFYDVTFDGESYNYRSNFEFELTDGNGNVLRCNRAYPESDAVKLECLGIGQLPDMLVLFINNEEAIRLEPVEG